MSYQIKRINPFWWAHPVVLGVAVVGLALALFGYKRGMWPLALIGAVVMSIGVLMATRPAVSAVLGTLGLFGGLVTFVVLPSPQTADLSVLLRMFSTLLFAFFYMVLMDALVLVVSALYNFFGGGMNLGGIQLEFEETAEGAEEQG